MSAQLPFEIETSARLPDVIQGYVSFKSQGKKSSFALKSIPRSAKSFHGKKQDRSAATKSVESSGMEIVAESALGMAVAGPSGAFEELTGGRVVTTERLLYAEGSRQRYVSHIDIVGKGQPHSCGCAKARASSMRIDGVLIERPRQLAGVWPSPIPPTVPQYHLRVPDDIAVGLGATGAHRAGDFGNNVRVAMVDSGQYAHPFFAAHGYNVRPAVTVVPQTDPGGDPVGHGTGESANIFAIAPGAQLEPYRASNNAGRLVGALAGFLAAKAASPDILTNSWGGDGPFPPQGPPDNFDIAWALEIIDAIQQGIVVIFSAGNGSFTIEPQVPGVLAAGGTYMENDIDLRASNYSSGYNSPWVNNRVVPDVCGLVGLLPRAAYIMLPVPPRSALDIGPSQPEFGAPGDGTAANDGWGLFSGTSAAAPQLAGIAALIKGVRPGARPAQVIAAMTRTAIDVRVGNCHPRFNNPAQLGDDFATGAGLANATRAVQFARDNF